MRPRKIVPVALGVALALASAACSGSDSKTTTSSGSSAPIADSDALTLKGTCPDKIVVQTDWFPEDEYSVFYGLLGPNANPNKSKFTISGPLIASGKDTGVTIEIRSGGDAIGGQQVSAAMYADKSITLGVVSTDEQIQNSQKQPTLAVFAPLDISPIMIMWDKDKHPEFNTISDIGQSDTKVLYFQTDTYMKYLTGAGILREKQLDGSYTGAPDQWVAQGGKVAQAGFATEEPYIYQHDLPKHYNIAYQLVNDTNYPMYGQATVIRAADKATLAPCLKKLVPILQQSQVDFMASPTKTTNLIVKTVNDYHGFWTYSAGEAAYAYDTIKKQNIISNGANSTLGDMDQARIQRMLDILKPIFESQGKALKPGLTPADLFTDEYINTKIGLKSS